MDDVHVQAEVDVQLDLLVTADPAIVRLLDPFDAALEEVTALDGEDGAGWSLSAGHVEIRWTLDHAELPGRPARRDPRQRRLRRPMRLRYFAVESRLRPDGGPGSLGSPCMIVGSGRSLCVQWNA